ncbi:uncharacterized protein HMPREF1541_07777 [Cyphellophora europaea CBS 101466]|uniref:Dilute domain-containing protein n=1 Tax=Cyphellophora europaea (strain CBS 101466) TaxID=1220924 RepID=W2RR03_CYPE1|nr:uncharacterized protein HMPREF1541_07777 [Cyphellophora europaea CBS 101466]ETN38153.1 hypothetical protein HMPREF1541_07777 [Cyphellophora europaea CBS 101466]
MDPTEPYAGASSPDATSPTSPKSPTRQLPADLPTSLDDRRGYKDPFAAETEYYDGWQGSSQFISAPTPARALTFDLKLDTPAYDEAETFARIQDSDTRLMEMVAAQQRQREDGTAAGDEDAIALDETLSHEDKAETLQKALNMAASNGDVTRVRKLVNGRAKTFIDVNLTDEEGTVPLIYASCFGHEGVVQALLDAGANVDKQDRNQWSALMWAMTNRHKVIAKLLLDHGANPDIRSSSGGTAYDFVQPGSDFSQYLAENGYHFGGGADALGEGDFYQGGWDQERLDEEYAEGEMRRRALMQESAANLEVDLSTLGFGEEQAPAEESDEEEEFIWERCVGDQMFVFQTDQLEKIFDLIITNMTPQRSPSQKPVPANLIFLMCRYAHYHMTSALLDEVLTKAMDRINDVIERYQWDMTMLAFWISNETLLLHYLKKDAGLFTSTTRYQAELAELVNETFILIIRDAERRMNKVLNDAVLDHETIPGLGDVEYQGEWNVFKSKAKQVDEPPEKRYRPPSPKQRAKPSPRNITSLLSSTLFVLDLYDVHSVITAQILAQLLYWLGAELFNRVIVQRRYMSRIKAMQIRMNVSQLEDWARANNRQPEHYENGSTVTTGEDIIAAARRHLSPIIQLLQWLQCFTGLGEDHQSLVDTLTQLQRLTPFQLLHTVKNYRAEVGEKSLSKAHVKFIKQLEKGQESLIRRPVTPVPDSGRATPVPQAQQSKENGSAAAQASSPDKDSDGKLMPPETPSMQATPSAPETASPSTTLTAPNSTGSSSTQPDSHQTHSQDADLSPKAKPGQLTLDQSMMLPFSLPTSTDMLISYGAGIGGANRERAKKYIPTVPVEVLGGLGLGGQAATTSPG